MLCLWECSILLSRGTMFLWNVVPMECSFGEFCACGKLCLKMLYKIETNKTDIGFLLILPRATFPHATFPHATFPHPHFHMPYFHVHILPPLVFHAATSAWSIVLVDGYRLLKQVTPVHGCRSDYLIINTSGKRYKDVSGSVHLEAGCSYRPPLNLHLQTKCITS